jgi:hypothetical protein
MEYKRLILRRDPRTIVSNLNQYLLFVKTKIYGYLSRFPESLCCIPAEGLQGYSDLDRVYLAKDRGLPNLALEANSRSLDFFPEFFDEVSDKLGQIHATKLGARWPGKQP